MGDMNGVKQWLAHGANVNAWHEQTGLTALHLAVGTNNLQLVKYLLETAGAELVPDRSGRWPTVIAAECCAGEELCDYIVEQEAKLLKS
jgi:ankyrin repeat protein